MQCFILAGGFATRLWPLTEKRAKPLLPVAGKPLITHLVEALPADMAVTVSTNAAFETGFRAWLETLGTRDVELVVERTRSDQEKLGALGAIALWIETAHIDDDLLILTGDNYLGFRMADFLAAYDGQALLAAHDIRDLQKASAFGTVVTGMQTGRTAAVTSFEEKPVQPKSTLVSAGCVILPKHALPVLVEFARKSPDNLGGIFEELLRQGEPVACYPFTEAWIDIGSFATYLEAHRLLLGGKAVMADGSGVQRTELRGSVSVAKGCRIEGSELQDCMIFEGNTITDCTLRDCVIDENCVLRGVDLSGKMIRAGTHLVVGS
jgi:glucose-1-phosphate thymidylyltransferase